MIFVIVQSSVLRPSLRVVRCKMPVDRRVRMMVVALVEMLRRKRRPGADDRRQEQNKRTSNRSKHEAVIMVRPTGVVNRLLLI